MPRKDDVIVLAGKGTRNLSGCRQKRTTILMSEKSWRNSLKNSRQGDFYCKVINN